MPPDDGVRGLRTHSAKLPSFFRRRFPMNPNYLDFEQPIADLEAKIQELRNASAGPAVNVEAEVHALQDKLRVRAADSRAARSKYENMLLELTRAELGECALFDEDGFVLQHLPADTLNAVELGRYELPRRSGDSHLYRIGHPLAEWVTEKAKGRALAGSRLVFDYDAHGIQVSTLKPYRGKTGWLTLKLVSVEALGNEEQRLVVAAITSDGQPLAEDDPEKLLRLPARTQSAGQGDSEVAKLREDVATRMSAVLREINQRNLGYFEQEVQKLDAWADDLKLGIEQEIKEIDRQIKEVRRTAASAPTLEEKLSWQKQQRELETKRTKLRRELFNKQDEIEAQRNDIISQLEVQLQQRVNECTLFTIEWELV